jgi:hypothetical protein
MEKSDLEVELMCLSLYFFLMIAYLKKTANWVGIFREKTYQPIGLLASRPQLNQQTT